MTRTIRRFYRVFLASLKSLCLIAVVACFIATGLWTYPFLDGWLDYRTAFDVVASIADLLSFAAAAGLALGVVTAFMAACAITAFSSSRSLRRDLLCVRRAAIWLAALVDGTFLLRNIVNWPKAVGLLDFSSEQKLGIWAVCLLAAIVILFFAKPRRQFASTLNGIYLSSAARRSVIMLGGAAAALTVTRRVAIPIERPPRPDPTGHKSSPNILLVTFDALTAEDMSLFGYRLPTTPEIGRFAENAAVFTNFYSYSTFTTPSVVSFLCGRYPSATHVHVLCGRLYGKETTRTLPYVLRANGYETGASVANFAAHPEVCGISGYDVAPPPPIKIDFIREAVRLNADGFTVIDAMRCDCVTCF